MARRLLSIWFPRLASDVSLRRRPLGPDPGFALAQRSGRAATAAGQIWVRSPAPGFAAALSPAAASAPAPGITPAPAATRAPVLPLLAPVSDPSPPFALVAGTGNAEHLHCLNAAAQARGLHRGMALAEARAILPQLLTRPADLPGERAALAALCRWAGRYGPQVAVDGSDGLIADVTGVAHLFGGEAELRADLQAGLARLGLSAASAIAPTRGAAWALARHGGGLIAAGGLAEGLQRLPVSALRIDHDTAAALTRLGLDHIGALLPLPRAPLARRFGPGLLARLDQALGRAPEPVSAAPPPPPLAVRLTLPEPIGLQADVMAGLGRLLHRLCDTLARHRLGARRLRLELRRVDHATARVEVGLARPLRNPQRIAALFARGVGEVDAAWGIDALRLSVVAAEPLAPEQLATQTVPPGGDALADLISRLGNRLGFERVQRLLPAESLIPERSFLIAPAAWSAAAAEPARTGPPRPAVLFPPEPLASPEGHPPRRFRWRRMPLSTQSATGPERIAPEWWFDDPAWRSGLRDYWRLQTCEGPRLWLFHTPQASGWPTARWFVQGEFI